MTLKVLPGPKLKVLTNMSVSEAEIFAFLEEREAWLMETIEEITRQSPVRRFHFANGEKLLSEGRFKTLHLIFRDLRKAQVVERGEEIFVLGPFPRAVEGLDAHVIASLSSAQETQLIQKALHKHFLEKAQPQMQARLQFWSERMQLAPKNLRLKKMRSRWGSCSTRGTINLNMRLVLAPEWVLDSVIIHELAHLKILNHSRAFYELVDGFDLRRLEADEWLKQHQYELLYL